VSGYQPPGPYHRPEPGVESYRESRDYQPARPSGYADSRAGYEVDADSDAPTTQFTRPADLGSPGDSVESKKDGSGPGPKKRAARKRPRGGKLIALAAGAVVLVLTVVSAGVWYLTGDTGQQPTSRAAPVSGDGSPDDVKAAVGLRLASSRTAEVLFPPTLRPLDKPEHTREAVGEADCSSVAASKAARTALTKVGCKKVYLALYVDEAKKYAVTFGYIDVGSAAKAEKGKNRDYGDYPKYNTWFKFLIPEGSKITTKTRIFTYVSADEKYVTFGTCAYYDGRHAKKELDKLLTREAIAVGVAIMFS
jgi:hypothetical protein